MFAKVNCPPLQKEIPQKTFKAMIVIRVKLAVIKALNNLPLKWGGG